MKAFLALILLLTFTACSSSKTIVNGLDERDANEIVVLLAQNHITAYKIQQAGGGGPGGSKAVAWDIAVSANDADDAMATLAKNGLPRVRSPNLIDLFSANGLVPSDISEKIRYRAGLADEIANMIRKMDGIVDADVQLSFPQEDPLNPNAKLPPITASVYVKHTGILDDPNAHLMSKIKQLVSGAVTGLSYDNVSVIGDRARFAISPTTLIHVAPQEYSNILGFVVANTSVNRFIIFLIFVAVLLVVAILLLVWLIWKIYPILGRRGGIKQLFHITALPEEQEKKE
jgi:type III secretion protein J